MLDQIHNVVRASDPVEVELELGFLDFVVGLTPQPITAGRVTCTGCLIIADTINPGIIWFRDSAANATGRAGVPLDAGKSLTISCGEAQAVFDREGLTRFADLPGGRVDPRRNLSPEFSPPAAKRVVINLNRYHVVASVASCVLHVQFEPYIRA